MILALAILIIILESFFLYFLRDPDRKPPMGDIIITPADGVVTEVRDEEGWKKIIIFMNPLNVHVQWIPYPGKITSVERMIGPAIPGYRSGASNNAQVITTFETRLGKMIVKQIVGILVRRIQSYVNPGNEVRPGERLGRIIFGSRVELWMPSDKVEVKVVPEQKVLAGLTIAAVPK